MMGSDYPRGEIETDPVGFVSTAGLTEDNRDKILTRNAMDAISASGNRCAVICIASWLGC